MTFEEWWATVETADIQEIVQTRLTLGEVKEIAKISWDRGATEALKMVFTAALVSEEKMKAEAERQRRLLL